MRDGSRVRITGADARHLARSLRARPGETISVVEPEGRLLTVELVAVSDHEVSGRVVAEVEHRPEADLRLIVGLAILPAPALDLSLSRCTELGAAGFLLVQADRSQGRGARPERWAGICREASMLAGRLVVPEVRGPLTLAEALAAAPAPHLCQRGAKRPLGGLERGGELGLFIGPEGGWSPRELELAGERLLSLGPRNLRADTAAIAATAIALR
jgi:16S rRNA (uracil1498-N3)-methyltransferase